MTDHNLILHVLLKAKPALDVVPGVLMDEGETLSVRVVSNIIVEVMLQLDLESYGVWTGYGVVSK